MHLQHDPLDPAALVASVSAPDRGALATFIGLVRDHHGGRDVLGLEYSAYGAMAEATCAAIVAEAERQWRVRIALAHRLGGLVVGEAAVVVVAASAYREAAFDACRWVIEAVKAQVPIWKREQYRDGTEAWVDPTAPGGTMPTGEPS